MGIQTFPDKCQAKKLSGQRITTDAELAQQLVREISLQGPELQRRYPDTKTTESPPRKFYYTGKTESDEVAAAESRDTVTIAGKPTGKTTAHDVYPLLSSYLWTEFALYSKRIEEKRSSNKRGPNGNRWLYPDVVGAEDLGAEWHQEIRDCVYQYSDKLTKLWPFKAKLLINGANVRKCFFSNSIEFFVGEFQLSGRCRH